MFTGLEMFEENFPNIILEDKIKKFNSVNDDETYKDLINELEKSIFLFPILSHNNNIEGFVLNEIENKKYISIFSNIDEFNKWYKDYELNFMFYSINEICRLINDKQNEYIDGFIIDPYGLNMIFNKDLIKLRISE